MVPRVGVTGQWWGWPRGMAAMFLRLRKRVAVSPVLERCGARISGDPGAALSSGQGSLGAVAPGEAGTGAGPGVAGPGLAVAGIVARSVIPPPDTDRRPGHRA